LSATATATQRNIKEREQRILALRGQSRTLPTKDSRRKLIQEQVQQLLTEIAALKSSLHYYKPTLQLSTDVEAQRRKVAALTAMFQKAGGTRKVAVGKQLRREAKELNQMLAAAQMQGVKPGLKAPLARKAQLELVQDNPISSGAVEGAALTEEEKGGKPPPEASKSTVEAVEAAAADQPNPEFEPSEFSISEVPSYAADALAKLDEYRDDEGDVWYKNPIVILGVVYLGWRAFRRG